MFAGYVRLIGSCIAWLAELAHEHAHVAPIGAEIKRRFHPLDNEPTAEQCCESSLGEVFLGFRVL